MRLTSIKLSGFKSFAEPTQFQLPGQLVAVVGPNGCGKSNIIDAVRWVLGESRASELRGESMQDVIFSGTTNRKPASRASVELVFDNADHRAGGQWNQYNEISVRRVLTRDGNSSYMINGQMVRRRDIQDVFLGTGLGPRAYAIIGQGTISRIIESRPEDLRLFLEEAAGVSKYKERRRETENRLHDTHENLTRVEDILRELNTQLEKLEKQARIAQRYHELQEKTTLRQQQVWWLKRQEAQDDEQHIGVQVAQAQTELESRMSELRKTESDMETIRQAHYAAGDAVNQAQGKLYEASSSVGKLEAEIRYVVEGRNRAQQRLQEILVQSTSWQQREQQAHDERKKIAEQMQDVQEEVVLLQAQCEQDAVQTPELEEQLRLKQQAVNTQRQAVLQVQQQIQMLANEQGLVDEQIQGLQQRRQRLAAEKSQLNLPDQQRLERLRLQLEEAKEQYEVSNAQLEELSGLLPELAEKRQAEQNQLYQEQALQTELDARIQVLSVLQDKVQTDGKLQPWLEKHGLASLTALWQKIHVDSGWENALESSLRERLAALEVGQLEILKGFVHDAPPVRLAFYTQAQVGATPQNAQWSALSDKIRTSDPTLKTLMADWLHGCWVADSLEQALAQRDQLASGHAFYVKSGHVTTRYSVSFYAADSEQAGMLARQQEIENLQKQQKAQLLIVEQVQAAYVRAQAAHQQNNLKHEELQRNTRMQQQQLHQLEVEVLQLNQQQASAQSRRSQLDMDLTEIDARMQTLQERKIAAEARFEELDLVLAAEQEKQARFDEQVMEAERVLAQGREQDRALERRLQEAQFNVRTLGARTEELQRTIESAHQQLAAFQSENERVQQELIQYDDAAAQAGLQEALDVKTACEQRLSELRAEYDDLSGRLRAADELRMQISHALDPMRQRVTELQLKAQASHIALEQYNGYLNEAQADLETLAQSVADEALELGALQEDMQRLERAISNLGAVNLAALEELTSAKERKTFLDAQVEDLNEAISKLEDAIRKIDTQTREQLSHTFNTVNSHFGVMFPELFGGGRAQLVMTGDEILDSGVQVMAQPPGKRNSTIHLLSGGEKALTAIALVFAIFQLNPAPFCLLDEVDAPLDDANTERYARLVSRMSSDTQFLFISHNKIAMEMAQQLIGVTMQEQGVSRIVAVDMDSAMGMAQA